MKNEKSVVILCESYASIAYPLYRLVNEKNTQIIICIVSVEDLFMFFNVLNEKVFNNKLKIIYYPGFTPVWDQKKGINKLLKIFTDIIRERRQLKQFYDNHFAHMEDVDILFTSPGYNGVKIYILDKVKIII